MSSNETTTTTKPSDATPAPPPARKRGRRGKTRPPAHPHERPATPLVMTIKEGAETLRTTVEALRARCRRAATTDAEGNIVAQLAPGIVAVKFGKNTWRLRFDAK